MENGKKLYHSGEGSVLLTRIFKNESMWRWR